MPHVELSLSDAESVGAPRPSLRRWAGVVAEAAEPCVALDADGVIVASSGTGTVLLGGPADGDGWIGRGLLDVLELVDLTATGERLPSWEAERIPPLLALSSGGLARGVIRVRVGELTRTLDAVSTPLRDGTTAVGSLTFLHRI